MRFLKNILYFLSWLVKIAIQPKSIFLYNKLNKLSLHSSNKELCILGNGNSLNEVLDDFNGEETDFMVVNRHVLSPSYIKIKPSFYVVADPFFFNNKEGVKILESINKTTTWPMVLFVPFTTNTLTIATRVFKESKNITLMPYNTIPYNGFEKVKQFLYKHNMSTPRVQNVLVASIYLGICLNFKSIKLYGVEHSWMKHLSVNDNNEVCLANPHFFDKDKPQVQTWKEIQKSDARLCDVLRMYAYMFESYFELKQFAANQQVKVYNCTKDSFIDAFERAN